MKIILNDENLDKLYNSCNCDYENKKWEAILNIDTKDKKMYITYTLYDGDEIVTKFNEDC